MEQPYFASDFTYAESNSLPESQALLQINLSDAHQRDGFSDFVKGTGDGAQHADPIADSIKHRRSRNGCLTCRNRRVKCDETRPCCERCRKGGRECVFPETTSKSKASKASKKSAQSVLTDTNGCHNDKDSADDHSTTHSYNTSRSPGGSSSILKLHDESDSHNSPAKSHSSFADSPASMADTVYSTTSGKETQQTRNWVALDASVRFYLKYHKEHLTNSHFGLTCSSSEFLHNFLIDLALGHDTLLYAVVSFAAYHYTLSRPGGAIRDFLGYYSKSLFMLRKAIKDSQSLSMDMLLTILVLCLLEEYLGDWVNLANHQKAAFKILTTLHNPKSITANYNLSKVLEFYIHFDCIAGFMAGAETSLSRDWYEAQRQYYAQMVQQEQSHHPMTPHNHMLLTYIYEEKYSSTRLLAKDVSIFFARRSKTASNDPDFLSEAAELTTRIDDWHRTVSPLIVDKTQAITDVPTTLPWESINAYELGSDILIYGGELLPTNNMLAGLWGLELMFKSRLALMQRTIPPPEVQLLAGKIFRVLEAAEYIDPANGAVLSVQASLGIACVFIRKESELKNWCCKKLATIESLGYFHPQSYRARLSESWGLDLTRWWLPNDEGFAPILRAIREFIEYRTTPTRDRVSEDMREMTGIFKSLAMNANIYDYI